VLDLLRRNRDFRALFSAQVISYMGDWFATVALLGLVLDLTDGWALAGGLVLASQTLPAFLVSPVAGPSVDRFDRKKMMVVISLGQVVAALMLFAVGPGRVWVAFVSMASIAALGAFFSPASQAAVPNIVDADDLPTATAMMSATWGAMLAIGSGLGAVFAVVFGRNASFAANALSFAVAAIILTTIRRPTQGIAKERAKGRMRPVRDTREALAFARQRPELLALLVSKAGLGFGAGVVGLLAVLAKDRYRGGDGITGLLLAARGAGALMGPVLARRYLSGTGPHLVRICALCALVYGAGYAVVSWAPFIALAVVAVFFAHVGGGTQWTVSTYGLQAMTPDDLRGRILSADFAVATATLSLSFVVAGVLADRVGAGPVIGLLAGVSAAWGVLYLALARRLEHQAATSL
jgi:MFS family permease